MFGLAVAAQPPISATSCSASSVSFPTIEGVQLQSTTANVVTNFSQYVSRGRYFSHEAVDVVGLDFCNVSVVYGHTGHDDAINVQVWLPLESWNGRMMGAGGGGWSAGLNVLTFDTMIGATAEGYSSVSTDAGIPFDKSEPENWALSDSGEVNLYALENFIHRALGEAAVIGKSITRGFYGSAPKYSYFNGCSTGGRQGLILSQLYPEAYNGIMSACPAINWPEFLVAELYPQLAMSQAGEYPHACELEALTAEAIMECDGNDGVVDGVVADFDACKFDPKTLVGRKVRCNVMDRSVKISSGAAKVAQAAWHGAKAINGSALWPGLFYDAMLSGVFSLANTKCSENGTCHGVPFQIAEKWIQYFVAKDPALDIGRLSAEEYERLYAVSETVYNNMAGSNNPDLHKFKETGGKILLWHGLADQVIFPGGSQRYYEAVLDQDKHARDFFRYFEAPGVYHCFHGPGPFPISAFDSLVKWVEQGEAPDVLDAVSPPDSRGKTFSRPLCPYPLVARHNGQRDPRLASSFYCAESYLSTTPVRLLWQHFKQSVLNFF